MTYSQNKEPVITTDLISGMTASIPSVPDAMDPGVLAGINPVYNLYRQMIGTPVAALFTGSTLMSVVATCAMTITIGTSLGAIVIMVVVFGLFKVKERRRLARISRIEFWIAVAALLGVLIFGTLQGVFLAVFLSLLCLIWCATHPQIQVLGKLPDTKEFHILENCRDARINPGMVNGRFDGPLFFVAANSLRARIRELTGDYVIPLQAIILGMERTSIIDLEGSFEPREVAQEFQDQDIGFYVGKGKPATIKLRNKIISSNTSLRNVSSPRLNQRWILPGKRWMRSNKNNTLITI